MNSPTLKGRHVLIEPLELRHAPGIAAAGSHDAIWPHMPRGPIRDTEDARSWIAAAHERSDSVALVIIDSASERVVGSTRFLAIDEDHRRVEIGYTWLEPASWRTALNTETKLLLLRHAFEQWGANRVEFKTDLKNERSQRALERIGAQREGVLRRHMIVRDQRVRDSVYYSIIREEWPEVAAALERALSS